MPIPQVALQSSHSPHSVTRQLLGAGGVHTVGVVRFVPGVRLPACPTHLRAPRPCPLPLTAFLVDCALLCLFRGQCAHRAVLWELLHVPFPGPHAHAT